MNMNILYWIWLAERCGSDSSAFLPLIHAMKTPEAIFKAEKETLAAIPGVPKTLAAALSDHSLDRPKRILEICAEKRIGILPFRASLYPERLRRIHCPPVVLYYRGAFPDFDKLLSVAVVGTRGMTDSGRMTAYRIAYELAVAGTIIVSGMAMGIDGTAQQAALDASGISVAVLGTAIDRCYPQEHLPLYKSLCASGCVISEYAPGTDTGRWSFPQRNRIISGLSQGTLVAEAGEKSGALITAECALTQGRDLFAVPGDPTDPARTGTNMLIKKGAVPVTASADILSRYAFLYDALHPEKVDNAAYFRGYDDRLRYAEEKIAERRDARPRYTGHPFQPSHPDEPEARTAPELLELREEPYAEDTENLLNRIFPRSGAYPAPVPPTEAHAEEPAAQAPDAVQKQVEEKPEEPLLPVPETPAKKPSGKPKPPAEPAVPPKPSPRTGPDLSSLTEEQRMILSLLRQRKTFDDICANGVDVGSLMTNLTILELDGFIRAVPGGYFETTDDETET